MSEALVRIGGLRSEAERLPECSTKVALLEEAAQVADAHNLLVVGYQVRQELMRAAVFSGRLDILMVAFTWCVAQFDRDPGQFSAWDLLWRYKWVVGNAPEFPELSLARIESLMNDMERRYSAAGCSFHAVMQKRRDVWVLLRNRERAAEAHQAMQRIPRDGVSDCRACVACNEGRYHEFQESWEQAWRSYEPVVAGKLSCVDEPLRTTSYALLPLLHLGRPDEARQLQWRVARRLSGKSDVVRSAAHQIAFLAIIGDLARAKRLFERHLPAALDAVAATDRLHFLRGALLLLARFAREGRDRVKFQLPQQCPPADERGLRMVHDLQACFSQEARTISEKFDARNGNDAYCRELQELPELLSLEPIIEGTP